LKKSIFITGAAAGIGKATAILFANKGWFVGITDVNEAGLKELTKFLGKKIGFSARLDVTDENRVAAVLCEFNHASGGKFDVLFNNAGILRINPFEDISLKDHHAILDINAKGVLNCSYNALPYLKNTAGSRVINMASVASIIATPTQATYSASKFWVRGFTEALNMEWGRHGIHVCDIMPNYVDTPMVEQNPGKLVENVGVSITAEDVAETVWRAVSSTRVHWLIDRPQNKLLIKLKGGMIPFSLLRFIMRKKAGI
jgi:NAD(P)-dependent dehydrogenase (short-subunit alcohol dehydrogenase family)